jgi:hypothetical protein
LRKLQWNSNYTIATGQFYPSNSNYTITTGQFYQSTFREGFAIWKKLLENSNYTITICNFTIQFPLGLSQKKMTSQDSGWGIHKKKCLRWTSIGPFCGKNEAVHHHVKEYATKIVIIFIQTTFPEKKLGKCGKGGGLTIRDSSLRSE